jgi:hypothetical protein
MPDGELSYSREDTSYEAFVGFLAGRLGLRLSATSLWGRVARDGRILSFRWTAS